MGWPRLVEGLAAQIDSVVKVSLAWYEECQVIDIPFVIDIEGSVHSEVEEGEVERREGKMAGRS